MSEMTMRLLQTIAGRLRVSGCMVLVLLVALSLIVGGSQAGHAHGGTSAEIYNAECPLAALAAFHGSSLPSKPLTSAWIVLAAGVIAIAPGERNPVSPTRLTDPRAPPAPSC
jgi:hypothetical protein